MSHTEDHEHNSLTRWEGGSNSSNSDGQRAVVVPKLSLLCFSPLQNLSFHPIDLSKPLPVTRLGSCSEDASGDDDRDCYGSQTRQPPFGDPLHHSLLKSRRVKCRKQVFYKTGLTNHWSDQKKLISAVQNAETAKVSDMLESGANPNVCDEKKRTPLHIAASQGQDSIVGLLLSKRADPNRQDILGNTPLHLAVCRGDLATVKVLIENGSNIFTADCSGRTPLSLVRSRLGGLRRNKSTCTNVFKTEFVLMSELLSSFAARVKAPEPFLTSLDELCNQMQMVSTRERADEITEAAIQQMGDSVSVLNLSSVSLM